MKKTLLLFAGALLAAMPISKAVVYAGPSDVVLRAGFTGNGLQNGSGYLYLQDLDAPLSASVQNGNLQFVSSSVVLDASTVTQSGSYLDPNTLQNKTINISFTFNPLIVNFAGTAALPLTPVSGGLNWSGVTNSSALYSITGSYQLAGPTQTVTGNFSLSLQTFDFLADGILQPVGSDQIRLYGLLNYGINLNGVVFDQTVDGIHLSLSAAGNGALDIIPPTGTTLTAVPETSVVGLAGLGALALLRRRRRH